MHDHKGPVCCKGCSSLHRGFCSQLPELVHEKLAEKVRFLDYPENRLLWDTDRPPNFVAIIREGFLRMVRYSVDGRRQIMALIGPGELIGEGFETRGGYSLEAATEVKLCRLERGAFERLTEEEPSIGRAYYRQCVERLDDLRRVTWSLGLQRPEERFCGFLVWARSTMPFFPKERGGVLRVQISRADIADYLGTTRETISRISQRFHSEGLIEIYDSATFYIPDFDRLAAISTVHHTIGQFPSASLRSGCVSKDVRLA